MMVSGVENGSGRDDAIGESEEEYSNSASHRAVGRRHCSMDRDGLIEKRGS